MNHESYTNWCITGLEGLVNMMEKLEEAQAPIPLEMATRWERAADRLKKLAARAADRVSDRNQ